MNIMVKKLKVGWCSFSCSEDSTILFTEMLNDHYKEWKNLIEFREFSLFQKREDIKDIDVAFVEGAIASYEQEEKLKKIRKNSQKLVAVGACAVVGFPSGQRNNFNEEMRKEIEYILLRFNYNDKVKKLSDIVGVDDIVPGCPMDENIFLNILNKYLKEFNIINIK